MWCSGAAMLVADNRRVSMVVAVAAGGVGVSTNGVHGFGARARRSTDSVEIH